MQAVMQNNVTDSDSTHVCGLDALRTLVVCLTCDLAMPEFKEPPRSARNTAVVMLTPQAIREVQAILDLEPLNQWGTL